MSQKYLAIINPGLEELLSQELAQFKTRKRHIITGGVEFEATHRGLYETLLFSRLANRIYLRLKSFKTTDINTFYRKIRRFDWERLLPPEIPLFFDITSHHSKLRGSGQLTKTAFQAIQDRFNKDLQLTAPSLLKKIPSFKDISETSQHPQRILIRLEDDQVTLSIDAAGKKMHQRGWRQLASKAPLRENLAAALLMALGWNTQDSLLDPACGSGTFIIEAALKRQYRSPRIWKSYALHSWNNFNADLWQEIQESSHQNLLYENPLFGRDIEKRAINTARQHAELAAVQQDVHFSQGDLTSLPNPPTQHGFIISNLPYGSRLLSKQLDEKKLAHSLIKEFERKYPDWILGILLPKELTLSSKTSEIEELLSFKNGGLPVHFYRITKKR